MEQAPVLIERRPGYRVLTLNRPQRLNAFTQAMHEALSAALTDAEEDADCRALLLTGAGRGFCSGQDLNDRLSSSGETAVLGAALDAKEAGCDVLAFSRDIDRDPARREAVAEGIRRVSSSLSAPPEVIGGVAVPGIEGWVLALLGERATEELSPLRAQAMLAAKGMMPDDGAAMVRVAEDADLDAVPQDATSLTEWIARARAVLPRRTGRIVR